MPVNLALREAGILLATAHSPTPAAPAHDTRHRPVGATARPRTPVARLQGGERTLRRAQGTSARRQPQVASSRPAAPVASGTAIEAANDRPTGVPTSQPSLTTRLAA